MTIKTRAVAALSWLGCLMLGSVGCQTWVGGMTLPSPDYLRDKPDYIAPAPLYKHSRELASMQRAMDEANPEMNRFPVRPAVPPVPTPVQPIPPNPAAAPGGAVPVPFNPMAPAPPAGNPNPVGPPGSTTPSGNTNPGGL
jgi:hypothetical protein